MPIVVLTSRGWSWFMLPWAFCAVIRALSSFFSSFFNGKNQLFCSFFPPIATCLSYAHVVLAIWVLSDKNYVGKTLLDGGRHWFSFLALSPWPSTFVFLIFSGKLSVLPRFVRFFNIDFGLKIFVSTVKSTCFTFMLWVFSTRSSPLEEY